MIDDRNSINDWLLDAHFGELPERDQARLDAELARDEQLAARNRRLERVLRPLDDFEVPAAPTDLVDRVMGRILTESGDSAVVRESDLPSGAEVLGGASWFKLRDLVGIAAVIAFFFGVMAPGMSAVRERSQRVQCAANLGAIGRGVGGYALDHNGALPRAYLFAKVSFLPKQETDEATPFMPNNRNLRLLARLKYVGSVDVFICPSDRRQGPRIVHQNGRPILAKEAINFSYDSQNMSGPTPRYSVMSAMPIAADANPLFSGGRFNPVNPQRANSPNHRGGRGQNVLCMDGSAQWHHTPNCGHQGDNIWQAGNLTQYTGTEVQRSEEDTFLVP